MQPTSNVSASDHWQRVYSEKPPDQVSWYQPVPAISLELIGDASGILIDIGGGASSLVDHLIDRPGVKVVVVDIAARALEHARARLGTKADRAGWIVSDVTGPLAELKSASVDVWHDRAVFHFLTTPEARLAYAKNLARILRPGGRAIIATFGPDGPERCSGLPVTRHDPDSVAAEMRRSGLDFTLIDSRCESHTTPWGSTQRFSYAVLRAPGSNGP